MNTHVRRLSMDTIGLSLSNAGLSDRMSRSEIALLLPSLPTASQVMMADIENGIFETKNLHIFAVCCEWALGTLHVAELWWDFLITAAALVVKDGFTLVLVAPTPRLTVRASAYLLEFTLRVQLETRRLHSSTGIQRRPHTLGRSVRRPA